LSPELVYDSYDGTIEYNKEEISKLEKNEENV